ncbi:MAG: hypothetical protein ACLSHG_01625 [Oscillospiraceae bacterium]
MEVLEYGGGVHRRRTRLRRAGLLARPDALVDAAVGGVCAVLIYLIAGRERTAALQRRWTLCCDRRRRWSISPACWSTSRLGWNGLELRRSDRSTSSGDLPAVCTLFWFGLAIPACGWGEPCGKDSPPGRLSKWCPAVPASLAVQPLPAAAARPLPRQPAAPAPWRSSRCGWCRAGPRRADKLLRVGKACDAAGGTDSRAAGSRCAAGTSSAVAPRRLEKPVEVLI